MLEDHYVLQNTKKNSVPLSAWETESCIADTIIQNVSEEEKFSAEETRPAAREENREAGSYLTTK